MTSTPPRGGGPQTSPQRAQGVDGIPTLGEAARQVGRGLGEGLLEIVMWAVAVTVVVGIPALLGWWLAGGWGLITGALVGAAVLAVTFVVLVVTGASLAAVLLRRQG